MTSNVIYFLLSILFLNWNFLYACFSLNGIYNPYFVLIHNIDRK